MADTRASSRSPGGRPKRADAEAIDRRVIEAARECFLARGFEATTMEAVAEHAGVTKATLYLRHTDKAALFRAVLAERMADWGAASRGTDWLQGSTLESRLKHLATTIVRASCQPEVRAFIKLVKGCWGSSEALAREFEQLLRANMLRLIAATMTDFHDRDGTPASNPRQAAALFLSMLGGFAPSAADIPPDEDAIRAFVDYAVAVFVHGRQAW